MEAILVPVVISKIGVNGSEGKLLGFELNRSEISLPFSNSSRYPLQNPSIFLSNLVRYSTFEYKSPIKLFL